jgi:mono/diheme cytochrome c family protein
MSKPKLNSIKLSLALAIALTAIAQLAGGSLGLAATAAGQDLPEGKGVEVARDKCLLCHEADLIVSQRLSKQGWVREVDKMIRWGAVVTDAEKEILVEYFSARFAPRNAATAASQQANEARGREIFENKCVVCHEADLTEQQRLTRQGWTREVEKMVRWGANVTEAEKEPLVDYLFKNFGPRPLLPRM